MSFFEFPMRNNVVEQLTSAHILHKHVIEIVEYNHLFEADDVWMMQQKHNACFTYSPHFSVLVFMLGCFFCMLFPYNFHRELQDQFVRRR